MKKIAAFLTITAFLAPFSFADTTQDANKGFDIAANASGTATVNVPVEANDTPEIKSVSINKNMQIIAMTKHEKDEQLPYNIDYTYPQITGESLSASALEFNRLVTDMVNTSVQQFKNYVKADMLHMQTLPDSVKHNTFTMNYVVDVIKPANQILISVRLAIEGLQAGRAHPYHTNQILNYDLSKKKVLSLKDIFKPGAKYLNEFAKYSNTELGKKLEDKWMLKDGTAPLLKNYQLWNLQNDGILITFAEYQVAPYASGAQEVKIPYSNLKKLIAPNAAIAACAKDVTGCKG